MKDQLRHNESQRRKEGRKEPPARDAQQEPSNRSFDPSVPPSLMATSRWLPVRLASPLTILALGLLVLSLSLSVAGASCCATGSSGHCCTTTQWPFVRHERARLLSLALTHLRDPRYSKRAVRATNTVATAAASRTTCAPATPRAAALRPARAAARAPTPYARRRSVLGARLRF